MPLLNGKADAIRREVVLLSQTQKQASTVDILHAMSRCGLPPSDLEDVVRLLVDSNCMRTVEAVGNCVFSRNGYQIHVHPLGQDTAVSDQLTIKGYYENFECKVLSRLIDPGDTVIDVGANLGVYTCLFADRVGPKGRVFAFEPDPANFALLQKNVTVNGLAQTSCYMAATSDRAGDVDLYLSNERNLGDHRIYACGSGRSKITVPCVTLDGFLGDSCPPVSLLKVDTQGADLNVVLGARELIARSPSVVLAIEFWPLGFEAMGHARLGFTRALRDMGFTSFWSVQEPHKEVLEVTDAIDSVNFPGSDWVLNLVCAKDRSHLSRLENLDA